MKAAIINYGVGNLGSVQKALTHLGIETTIVNSPEAVRNAHCIVLPGQGAFAEGMYHLNKLGLAQPIKDHIAAKKPYLGICLGMQLLFEKSLENGEHEGLGVFQGTIQPFDPTQVKVPQMGWNKLSVVQPHPALKEADEKYVYYANSYFVRAQSTPQAAAVTEYGNETIVGVVAQGPLLAAQFHPEKSADAGLGILKNYFESLNA